MNGWTRLACVGGALVAVMGLSGCESGCNEQTAERAVRFLETHQSCEVDADCVIVDDFCGEIPGGETHCGQLTMNRQGEQSGEWQQIKEDLGDCAPSECARCLSLRGTGCTNGSCGGP